MAAAATAYRIEQDQKERRFEEIIGNSAALQPYIREWVTRERAERKTRR